MTNLCTVEGCGRALKAKGLCGSHRYRLDNGLPLDTPIRPYESGERRCKMLGCDQFRGSDGTYCQMHLKRLKRDGTLGDPSRRRMPPGQAIWDKPNAKRRYNLRYNYGITPEQYMELFVEQDGRCAICKADEPGGKHKNSPNKSDWNWLVDHNHTTGAVRGLLCERCNRALGLFGDDPAILAVATVYAARS